MSTIRAMAAVNLQNGDGTTLAAGAIVRVDPDVEPIAGYIRGGYLKPVAMAVQMQSGEPRKRSAK
jgi:hypothetical protein